MDIKPEDRNIDNIGDIENEMGGLKVATEGGKYFWGIAEYDNSVGKWQEIPKSLYDKLIFFETTK